jgi:predicted dehydrogenase
MVRIAILGCGAVTARGHLPALARIQDAQVKVLADINEDRAKQLATSFGVSYALTDYHNAMDEFDVAIIALPHYLHAPVGLELLRAGKHLLMEKPMALTTAECDALLKAAKLGNAILSIGMVRRYLHSYRFVREVLQGGLIGQINSFDIQEGCVYNWPVASDFFFRRDKAGGGVLMDTGAHVLDSMLWWLGDCTTESYEDDAHGGVEADCRAIVKTESGASGLISLSRLRDLRNTAIIHGKKASLEISMLNNEIKLTTADKRDELLGTARTAGTNERGQNTLDLFVRQLEEWFKAIRGEPSECVTGDEGRRSIELIESCYAQRRMVLQPWQTAGIPGLEAIG